MGKIMNLDKIHKIKRDKIKNGLLFVDKENAKDNVIQKIIIFGSSITEDCTNNSDIDICIFTNYDTKNMTFFTIFGKLPLIIDDLCDIVVYSKINGKLKEEIDKKGVIVYESQ